MVIFEHMLSPSYAKAVQPTTELIVKNNYKSHEPQFLDKTLFS